VQFPGDPVLTFPTPLPAKTQQLHADDDPSLHTAETPLPQVVLTWHWLASRVKAVQASVACVWLYVPLATQSVKVWPTPLSCLVWQAPFAQQPVPAHSQPLAVSPSQFWKPAAHFVSVHVPVGQVATALG
jgi:hypothetical protein